MTRRSRFLSIALIASALFLSCSSEQDPLQEKAVRTTPENAFTTVNGVRLQYLDWGGSGSVLVLLHGFGDSPHIFDHLASELRNDFRVIAYARRGHAQSDAPDDPYDNATLVEDLSQLLDSLGISEANLLGWSMGGNEITEFAGQYPERTLKIVYLEAGYDWSDAAFQKAEELLLTGFEPDSAALRSLDAFRKWYWRVWTFGPKWTPGLEAYLLDLTRIGPDGTVQPIPNDEVSEKLNASLAASPREYSAVKARALALYSSNFLDTNLDDPVAAQALEAWERQTMDPFRWQSIERISQELSGVVIREIPNTTHMSIGFVNQEELVTMIRDFLTAGN